MREPECGGGSQFWGNVTLRAGGLRYGALRRPQVKQGILQCFGLVVKAHRSWARPAVIDLVLLVLDLLAALLAVEEVARDLVSAVSVVEFRVHGPGSQPENWKPLKHRKEVKPSARGTNTLNLNTLLVAPHSHSTLGTLRRVGGRGGRGP